MPSNEVSEAQAEESERRQEIAVGETELVALGEFVSDPERIIERVNESQSPAAVTRHGEFIALILPLAGTGLEHFVSTSKLGREHLEAIIADSRRGPYYTMEQIEKELGVNSAERGGEAVG